MSIERRKVLYVAGPYSLHPNWCTWAAMNTAKAIILHTEWTPMVPHLTHFWDACFPAGYQQWLDYDRDMLAICDGFMRLPGPSSGADEETKWAERYDLEVISFDEMPPEVCNSWLVPMTTFGLLPREGVNDGHHAEPSQPA